MGDLVTRLRYLASLNDERNGGPYGGYAATKCMEAMAEAATAIAARDAEIERLRSAIAWYGNSDPDAMNAIIARVAAAIPKQKTETES